MRGEAIGEVVGGDGANSKGENGRRTVYMFSMGTKQDIECVLRMGTKIRGPAQGWLRIYCVLDVFYSEGFENLTWPFVRSIPWTCRGM